MELTPVQRLVTFAVVVVVLVGLGVYLFLPSASAGHVPGSARSLPAVAGRTANPPAQPGSGGAGSGGPTAPAASGTGQLPDIYQWLPFTPAGLASAAHTATTFAVSYGTFSYTESTAAYLAPMKPITTTQLAALIGRAYSAPGVAAARSSGKQVSTATAVITSLRAFGPSSLTFVMVISQRITGNTGPQQQATGYAVTLTGAGTSWQVSDIELASAGNP
ncbi:MAG TPA: hypothetical protein VNF47_02270 [Streptosporangiaceae bacterium]|nr:hypothetical protein [Streptosporangiaceae bacterium]